MHSKLSFDLALKRSISCKYAHALSAVATRWCCHCDAFAAVSVTQEVLLRVVRSEGFFSLWKGFTPYYARLGPHTVLTFIFLEQMNRLYKTYVLER